MDAKNGHTIVFNVQTNLSAKDARYLHLQYSYHNGLLPGRPGLCEILGRSADRKSFDQQRFC